MNFLPLCTAMVCPTISGEIVERRDQVRMTFLSFLLFMSSILFNRWPSMCGPFFTENAIFLSPAHDELIGAHVVAVFVTASVLSQGRDLMTSAGIHTFTTV